MEQTNPKTVLLFGEGVTAAHVIRPLALARKFDHQQVRAVLACPERFRPMALQAGVEWRPLRSISTQVFTERLTRGTPLYTLEELRGYVQEDLRLIAGVRPDAIVGDFRISLGISAELCGVPHFTLSNAHWSPSARLPLPIPDHSMIRWIGERNWGRVFRATAPLFLQWQAKAFNRLRRAYGLTPVGGRGAPEVYTKGNRVLHLDSPALYPEVQIEEHERFIGPVLWAPDSRQPDWWDTMPSTRPCVFMSAGSSGHGQAMRQAIRALGDANSTLMVATAGRFDHAELPASVYSADFIPGMQAAERADAVVCNGGSGLVYQALANGKPILGIPTNMDQYYVMEAVVRQGAGRLLRSGAMKPERVRHEVSLLLNDPSYRESAERLKSDIAAADPGKALESEILSAGPTETQRDFVLERMPCQNRGFRASLDPT